LSKQSCMSACDREPRMPHSLVDSVKFCLKYNYWIKGLQYCLWRLNLRDKVYAYWNLQRMCHLTIYNYFIYREVKGILLYQGFPWLILSTKHPKLVKGTRGLVKILFSEKIVVHIFIVFWDQNEWIFSRKLCRTGDFFT